MTSPQPFIPRVERAHRLIEEVRGTAPRPLSAKALAGRLASRYAWSNATTR